MKYIWEQKDWPNFFWDKNVTDPICREIAFQLGALRGRVGVLENEESLQKELDNLLKNILHSFEIEGENLDAHSVRSSLAKRLKINSAKKLETKKSEGLADLQMDVLKKSNSKMTKSRLFGWHKLLFLESEKDVAIGKWRKKETMRIVSGRLDKPKIHFEAPPHNKIEKEMKILLEWLNNPKDNTDPFVKAGIVQYWFLTIHPFEDGNGRISRYLSELILANYNNCCIRMYSLSSTILKKRKEYYEILEKSQKGSLDITEWLRWFLNVLLKSICLLNFSRLLRNLDVSTCLEFASSFIFFSSLSFSTSISLFGFERFLI